MRRFVVAAFGAALGAALSLAPASARAGDPEFTSERVFARADDDWEPSVAADRFGHAYLFTTRYGDVPPCDTCPDHFIKYKRSSDYGHTWSEEEFLCECPGIGFQNDPVAVTDDQGRVFITWLNDFHIAFSRSDDFGLSWTPPVLLDPPLRGGDKPWIGASASGEVVTIMFNGPPFGTPYAVTSHDAGDSWEGPVKAAETDGLYFFSSGSAVGPDGALYSAQNAYPQEYDGDIVLLVLRSRDGGASWQKLRVDRAEQQRACPDWAGCPAAYFGAQIAMASDVEGRLYVLYNRNGVAGGPSRLFLRYSDDGGDTWSAKIDVGAGAAHVDHQFPMLAATGHGDVRVVWMDDRTGRWNTFHRRSTDGGVTWGTESLLSDRLQGGPYKSPDGFRFPYGDYGQITVDGQGMTVATWGEGSSYIGPGGVW